MQHKTFSNNTSNEIIRLPRYVNTSQQYNSRKRGNNTSKRTKRSNTRKKQRNNGNKGARPSIVYSLPDINNKPIQTRCVRYIGSTTSATFNSQDIRCFAGSVVSGSTGYYPILQGFKLIRVGLTLVCDSSTSAGFVTFSWDGANSPDVEHTMIIGPGFPNHRSFWPPLATTAWDWHDATDTTTNIFTLICDDGSIKIFLDLEFEYVIADGAITNVPLTTTAGLTGIVYRTLPITGLTFMPVGLNTDT